MLEPDTQQCCVEDFNNAGTPTRAERCPLWTTTEEDNYMTTQNTGSVLVVGGGIGGMRAALDLADAGLTHSQFAVLVPGLDDIENAERLAYSIIERLETSTSSKILRRRSFATDSSSFRLS